MLEVLLVEDKPNVRNWMRRTLEQRGHRVLEADCGRQGQSMLFSGHRPDVVVSDLIMDDVTGIEFFDWSRGLQDPPPFLLVSAYAQVLFSAAAQRRGLAVLEKTGSAPELHAGISRALEIHAAAQGRDRSRVNIGYAPVPQDELQRIANSPESVMLLGESGVGKTMLAQRIHRMSPRASGPFVKVSGAELKTDLAASRLFGHERGAFTGAHALHRGALEEANGGTLFIDEVADLDAPMQSFWLRFLDDQVVQRLGSNTSKRVDVRIISATNRDLREEAEHGRFRSDLMYRLMVIDLLIPPIRDDPAELERLVDAECEHVARLHRRPPLRFSRAARAALLAYGWPGNLRELDRQIKSLSARKAPGVVIEQSDLPPWIGAVIPVEPSSTPQVSGSVCCPERFEERDDLPSLMPYMDDISAFTEVLEYRAILLALRKRKGVFAKAARDLGCVRPTLYSRMQGYRKKYGDWPPLVQQVDG